MKDGLRDQVIARARGLCECGCGKSVSVRGEIDHFFGRLHAEESLATTWLLTPECHFLKTRNSPTFSVWATRFIEHCKLYGYVESQQRAEARRFYADTRRDFARGATR